MAKKPPNDKHVSPRDEREILDSFRESFQHDFPNPQRIGCPGGEVLRALGWRRKLDNPEAVVTHIGKCSPCFQEHRVFLREYKSRQRLYRLAAVAVLVVGVGFWISWKLMTGPGSIVPGPPPIVKAPPQPASPVPSPVPPSTQEQKPAEVQVAVLDLRRRGVTRGESNNQKGDLVLPRGRIQLSIYLPIGSEEGDYEVGIFGTQAQSPMARGKAGMRGHLNVLTVNIDTGNFPAGKYSLGIRRFESGWNKYPLNLREESKAITSERQ
ncbi:MAG: hypothetical protein L0387_42570 [Acidobacteria bacterium]|nr:hypothetical protein [Acidobacteriota bacterium]MCI0722006.1 hypothetical protein [Acidobacteriota bacterium]